LPFSVAQVTIGRLFSSSYGLFVADNRIIQFLRLYPLAAFSFSLQTTSKQIGERSHSGGISLARADAIACQPFLGHFLVRQLNSHSGDFHPEVNFLVPSTP